MHFSLKRKHQSFIFARHLLQAADQNMCTQAPDDLPTRDELLSSLWVFIEEMKAAGQLVVPTLRWDPGSADENEVLAIARVGLLITSYEPKYYWFDF